MPCSFASFPPCDDLAGITPAGISFACMSHSKRGVVIIDQHPLGFLHACYWDDGRDRGDNAIPDDYKTARRGQSVGEFRDVCVKAWPEAEVRCVVVH